MNKRRIIPIVEGHGEERAVPHLIKRWLRHRRFHPYFDVPDQAINTKGCGKIKASYDTRRHLGIEHYVTAALRGRPAAIIIIIDADDECMKRGPGNSLGPELLARARKVAPHIPLAVVAADPEYEAWFLASIDSIRASGLLPESSKRVPRIQNPESHRGCKKMIADLLCGSYEETVHQLKLSRALSFSQTVRQRAPSYDKLLRDLERILQESRKNRKVR